MEKKKFDYNEFIKQLEDAATQLPEILPDMISTLLGKPVNDHVKKELEKSASNLQEMVTKIGPSFSALKDIKDKKARNRELINLAESGFKPYIKDIPKGQSVMDYIIEYFDITKPLQKGSFLLKTSYEKYTATVTEISKDFIASVPINTRSEFLESVFSSGNDVLSMGQTVMKDFNKMNREFSLPRKRYTKQKATKDIEYYDKLAGQVEKCISTVAGVIELINGRSVTYESMRKRGLAQNLKIVNKSKYAFLTAGFDKIIRNALAHKQVVFHPQKRNVTFYDQIAHNSIDLTYKQISERTKELCALFITIQRLPMKIWSDTFTHFKNSV